MALACEDIQFEASAVEAMAFRFIEKNWLMPNRRVAPNFQGIV